MKAKYYPHTTFLNSSLKVNASYTWKSIWETKKVLRDDSGWRVSKGDAIFIFNDAWILGSFNYQLSSPISNCKLELVVELINNDREWKNI